MRITLKDGTVAEGTAQELADYQNFRHFHGFKGAAEPEQKVELQTKAEDFTYVSESVAHRVLNRLKLSPAQIKMLRLMHANGEKWTLATDIQKTIGYSASQFAGLMGAFGRRVAYTPGYVVDSSFFEADWDYENSCYRYRLPVSVRSAMSALKLG